MKLLIAALVFVASAVAADSRFAGVWEGEMNGQPAVQVSLKEVGGKLTGTIVFYFQERGADGKWVVKDRNPGEGEMLALKAEGKSVTFEVRHHKQHGGTEWGPNVPFRVEVTGGDEARLFKLDAAEIGSGFKLARKNRR